MMSHTEYARELVAEAKNSKHHVTWRATEELPSSYGTMQRLVNLVSDSGCKVKTYNGKFVVVDLSWIE